MAGNNPLLSTEATWFDNRRRQIRRAYDLGTEQNKYDQSLAQHGYNWDRQNMLRQIAQQRSALPRGFNRRGMMNSGVWQRGLTDFNTDSSNALARLGEAWRLRSDGFTLTENQLKRVRDEALSELEDQQQALRDLRNETIRGVQ